MELRRLELRDGSPRVPCSPARLKMPTAVYTERGQWLVEPLVCRALRGIPPHPPRAEHRAIGGAGSDSGDHPWGNRHEIRARSAVGKLRGKG